MSYSRPAYDSGPCFVYLLIDPRTCEVFYVGVSIDPWNRINGHKGDPGSSAYHRVREIIQSGHEVAIEILDEWATRREAERQERKAIALLPNLVNRERRNP